MNQNLNEVKKMLLDIAANEVDTGDRKLIQKMGYAIQEIAGLEAAGAFMVTHSHGLEGSYTVAEAIAAVDAAVLAA